MAGTRSVRCNTLSIIRMSLTAIYKTNKYHPQDERSTSSKSVLVAPLKLTVHNCVRTWVSSWWRYLSTFCGHRALLPPKITPPPLRDSAAESPTSPCHTASAGKPHHSIIQPSILPSISKSIHHSIYPSITPSIHPSIYSFHPFFPPTNPFQSWMGEWMDGVGEWMGWING